METRANYAIIGLFTLLVLAAAFLFVYWFAVSESAGERAQIRIVFEGSVAGLSRGAPVNFNGLRVGEVTELAISEENPSLVVARVTVDPTIPLREDTTAQLEFQGLTGIASVALSGGSPQADSLFDPQEAGIPTIEAEASDYQDLIESARNIARRASDVFDRFDALVSENDQAIASTVQNVEAFSRALAENAPAIDRFLEQVGAAAERIGPLADSLDELSRNVNSVVAAVDSESVARSVENVEAFTQTLADAQGQLAQVFDDASGIVSRLNETATNVEATVADVRAFVGALDAEALDATVTNVRAFSQTLADNREELASVIDSTATLTQNLAQSSQRLDATLSNVEGVSETVAANRDNIDRILNQAGELTTRLNAASDTLQTTLSQIDGLIGAVDPARVETTLANVEAFSDVLARNTDNVDAIIADARTLTTSLEATAGRLDGTVGRVDALVSAVDPATVAATLENARSFSQTLADTRADLVATLAEARDIAAAIDPAMIEATIGNVQGFSQTLATNREAVDRVIANAESLTQTLAQTSTRLDGAIDRVETLVAAVDPTAVSETVANARAFSQTLADNSGNVTLALEEIGRIAQAIDAERIERVIANVESFSQTLDANSDEVDLIVANAVSISEQLEASAGRVDRVLQSAEDFLGTAAGEEGEALFDEIRQAVEAIRTLATNLDERTQTLTDDIGRFTGPGLQEVRGLAEEGRRTLEDIGRAVRSIERDPSQVIFGGDGGGGGVREYQGRR
ncbi:MCE family protein [Salinarimonas ramus]|nr:MlaD family protein [Salinarimonas ramus]